MGNIFNEFLINFDSVFQKIFPTLLRWRKKLSIVVSWSLRPTGLASTILLLSLQVFSNPKIGADSKISLNPKTIDNVAN